MKVFFFLKTLVFVTSLDIMYTLLHVVIWFSCVKRQTNATLALGSNPTETTSKNFFFLKTMYLRIAPVISA